MEITAQNAAYRAWFKNVFMPAVRERMAQYFEGIPQSEWTPLPS